MVTEARTGPAVAPPRPSTPSTVKKATATESPEYTVSRQKPPPPRADAGLAPDEDDNETAVAAGDADDENDPQVIAASAPKARK
jgi:hypothetical protein